MTLTVRTGAGEPLFVTPHALVRWHERCRPGMSLDGARADFAQVWSAIALEVRQLPAWVNADDEERPRDADRYFMLGPDVVLPVRGRAVVTVIVPSISDATRAHRAERRKTRAETRRRRRSEGRPVRSPRFRASS